MERRHHVQAGELGVARGFFGGRLKVLAMLDQFGAERAHGAVLLHRIAARHINHGRNAVAAGRERKALPVIAARGGNDPGRIRPLALQPVEIDQPAAHLEGADRRVVLVLDHDGRAEPLASSGQACAGVGGTACPTISCARSSSARDQTSAVHLTPAPCRRRRRWRWPRRWPPPAAASRYAPCRTESSGSSFPARRPGSRTAPAA